MKNGASKVRYAVVGLGHIAQVAVLPGFAHARSNSTLTALVSGDPVKRRKLGKRYGAEAVGYAGYDRLLESGKVDAVYIALPNSLHADFTIRAARAGVHVLCEKPLAVTEKECRAMIAACEKGRVKLMTAYRLHFEAANLRAIDSVMSGSVGEPQFFNSVFSMQVREGDIRLKKAMGGGTLYDIGIYCINAARYLFRDEPTEVFAFSVRPKDSRFQEVDGISSALLKFPKNRLASFTSSFGSSDLATYRLVGSKGNLELRMAYEYASEIEMRLTVDGRDQTRSFARRDQFAAELVYFSDCILANKMPEPSGLEGLADVRIIEALYQSARRGKPVRISPVRKTARPTRKQEIQRPPSRMPGLVNVTSPTR